MQYAASDAKRM